MTFSEAGVTPRYWTDKKTGKTSNHVDDLRNNIVYGDVMFSSGHGSHPFQAHPESLDAEAAQ